MERVNLFLARFTQLLPPDARVKEATKQVLSEELDLELNLDQIEVKRGQIYIQVSPLVKNLLFINRERVTEQITKRLGEPRPRRLS